MGFTNQAATVEITFNAYVLKVDRGDGNGQVDIGAFQSINPSEEREISESYEIGRSLTGEERVGEPFEIVPGLVRRKTLEVNRLALWSKEMLQVFGNDDIVTLQEQSNYFDVYEYRQAPTDTDPVLIRIYKECLVASWGGTRDITRGDIREIQRATIHYTYVARPKTEGGTTA